MVHYVTVAEQYLASQEKPAKKAALPAKLARPEDIAPLLRGAVAFPRGEGRFDRFVADFRTSPKVLEFLAGADLEWLAASGVTRRSLDPHQDGTDRAHAPEAGDTEGYAAKVKDRVAKYVADYTDYFTANNARDDISRTMLDPMPRLALAPGLGMFGFGRTYKDARIASDVGEMWIEAVTGAEAADVPSAVQGGTLRAGILVAGAGEARRQQPSL